MGNREEKGITPGKQQSQECCPSPWVPAPHTLHLADGLFTPTTFTLSLGCTPRVHHIFHFFFFFLRILKLLLKRWQHNPKRLQSSHSVPLVVPSSTLPCNKTGAGRKMLLHAAVKDIKISLSPDCRSKSKPATVFPDVSSLDSV